MFWRGERLPAWRREGTDPDYRFSLANERTFLSWLRTSLALMAGAVAVVQLVPAHHLRGARHVLGVLLAIIGLVISATAYARWAANERAMRNREPLPSTPLLIVVSVGVVVVAALVLAVVVSG